MKDMLRIFTVFSILLLLIPSVVFLRDKPSEKASQAVVSTDWLEIGNVNILNNESGKLSEIPLRDYLIGSVLAQIPHDFPEEALKAQAVLCRTYIMGRRLSESESPTKELLGADISDDHGVYQKYFTEADARAFYGESYEEAFENAANAVDETEGVFISYGGKPIITAFHAISGGMTESAENVWGTYIPYLLAVESPEDESFSGFREETVFTAEELYGRLSANLNLEISGEGCLISVGEKTPSGTVKQVEITVGGEKKTVSGSDFAVALNLNSCCFSVTFSDGKYTADCLGRGHMVGLSQCGARAMAESGADYREIINRYFTGVSIDSAGEN